MHRTPSYTVLLVGEGQTELAFLKHLKSLYISRGCGVAVKIISTNGKGPEFIVNYTIRRSHRIASDRILTLLDGDIPITPRIRKKARQHHIELVESSPCFEGLLIKIIDKPVPATSKKCKKICRNYFDGSLTQQSTYNNLTLKTLERRRNCIPELAQILDSFIF